MVTVGTANRRSPTASVRVGGLAHRRVDEREGADRAHQKAGRENSENESISELALFAKGKILAYDYAKKNPP